MSRKLSAEVLSLLGENKRLEGTVCERELYTALQPKFREILKDWSAGDRLYDPDFKKVRIVTKVFNPTWIKCDNCHHWSTDDAIHLPLPIDPDDDERLAKGEQPRGLLGMIQGFMALTTTGDKWNCITWSGSVEDWYQGATPTEALLRALCAQWGVEVEG